MEIERGTVRLILDTDPDPAQDLERDPVPAPDLFRDPVPPQSLHKDSALAWFLTGIRLWLKTLIGIRIQPRGYRY